MTRQKVLLAYNTSSPPADSVLAARALNVIEAESRSRTQNETESAIGNPSSTSGPSPLQLKELNELPASSTRGWRFYGAFGTLCLVTFIIALDSTIICVALPTIAEDVGATAIEAFWCGTSFLLASTVVQPPVASLSHIFSRRSALLASLTVFVAGSIMAALAKNIAVLLGGRTFQGLGSGGILALTYVIATDLVSLRERGGIVYDWSRPRTVIHLIFDIMGLISFGFHIKFCRKYSRCDPLLRPSLFTSLTALSAYFATVIHGITVRCLLYNVPLYHEVRGSSPITAGVAVMPFTGTVAPAAVIVGLLVAQTGTYRPFIWAGWVLVPIGTGLMLLLDDHTDTHLPYWGSWSRFYAFCRSLGQGIGVAVGGVTFQNEFRKEVEKSPEFASEANEWAKDASALVQILKRSPSSMQLMKETIIDGYIKGLRTVWLVLAFLACIAFLVSLICVKAKSLDRKFE
ncbi:multidrug transporter [Fusarium tjaetaba]|uniref:Multidrug transporter n=1 Tax=Fusarium tjaetaba TaxID=1567544 RepID=A0A8H5SGF8_9HYPO|nr:multidrug transporter [Fusarium tjaetaba]KAF5650519.1 multidrug transporter [Fusarium tjaetaba]